MNDYMNDAFEAWFKNQIWGNEDFKACLSEAWQAALLTHIQREAVPEGWKEATIAWEVCASIHREYAKKKDPFFTTRQADFVKHTEAARAGLLAHLQRGAVPEGWQLVPKEPTPEMLAGGWGYWLNVMAPGKQRDTAAKEYTAMLAAAPVPDHFRDAAEMMADPADPDPLHLSRILHELAGAASLCWEPRPAGVFDSQLAIQFVEQALSEIRSRMTPAPAEVPMPEPDWITFSRNTDGVGVRVDSLRMESVARYGAACRAAGEAAGYARGLKEAGRDGERLNFLENECNDLRAVSTGEDDYEWAVISHHMAPPKEREVGSGRNVRDAIDAALRGEVKP